MSSIIVKLFNLSCYNSFTGEIDLVNPSYCLTTSGIKLNPLLILTADIFLVLGGFFLLYYFISYLLRKLLGGKK